MSLENTGTLSKVDGLKQMLMAEIPEFVNGRRTESTGQAYQRDLIHYFDNINRVTFDETKRYFDSLSAEYSKATITRKRAALSKFYDVVLEKAKVKGYEVGNINLNFFKTNIIKECVERSVKKAKKHGNKPLPKHLKWWEVEKLLDVCRNSSENELVAIRNRVIILFGVYGGLRRSEMKDAKWEDIEDDNRALSVDGKGGEGKIHLHKRIIEALAELKAVYQRWGIDSEYILISTTPQTFGQPMSNIQLNRLVKQLTKGIKDITVHDLRHTCAVALIEKGAGIEAVAKHLRHKNIETTRIYLQSKELHENAAADLLP